MGFSLDTRVLTPGEVSGDKMILPKPVVSCELKNVNGKDGIFVGAFFPLPEDEVVEHFKTTRYGKITYQKDDAGEYLLDTNGQKLIKEDNSKKVSSILTILGVAEDIPLQIPTGNTNVDGSPEMAALTDTETKTDFVFRASIQGRAVNADVPSEDNS